jgi:hypothetical protein
MKKKIIISIAAVLIISMALVLFSMLLAPKYITNPEGRLTGEYYSQSGGNDVIFLGDCEVYETFVPAILWEKYGISSYVRGSAQQLIWQSYYILEETLKYEKPKAVVFNVYSLKYGKPQSEAFNRMTFDTMKWSKSKFDAISASMTNDESMLDYIFPLLRYHSRITELESSEVIQNTAISDNSKSITGLNQRLDKTNTRLDKVGAGAAALAALHPLEYDPDDKLTFSVGMGNYSGENAAALGAFYRPNEKLMFTLGGTMGNGENMVNVGVSIGLDKSNGFAKMSKRELIQEVTAVKAENEAMKAEMVEMKEMLQKLLAKN